MIGKTDKFWGRLWKTVSVKVEVTSGGRLFQGWLPATGNARLPTVDSHVRRISGRQDANSWNRRSHGGVACTYTPGLEY